MLGKYINKINYNIIHIINSVKLNILKKRIINYISLLII